MTKEVDFEKELFAAEGIAIHPAMSVKGMLSRYGDIVRMIHATGEVHIAQLLLPIYYTHEVDVPNDFDTAVKRLPYVLILMLIGLTTEEISDGMLEKQVNDLDAEIQRLHSQGLSARSVLNALRTKP